MTSRLALALSQGFDNPEAVKKGYDHQTRLFEARGIGRGIAGSSVEGEAEVRVGGCLGLGRHPKTGFFRQPAGNHL